MSTSLTDGTEVDGKKIDCYRIVIGIQDVIGSNPITLFEVVSLARNPDYALFDASDGGRLPLPFLGNQLIEAGLAQREEGGKIVLKPMVAQIILAGAQGEGIDRTWTNPIPE